MATADEPFDIETTVEFIFDRICSSPALALSIIGQIALAADSAPNASHPDPQFYRETIDQILEEFWDSFNITPEDQHASN